MPSSSLSLSLFMRSCLALFAVLCATFTFVQASSAPQRPLKRLAKPSVNSLEILPRLHQRSSLIFPPPSTQDSSILQHTDSFRLSISAFGQIYNLHLRPNNDLLHPSARINFYKNGPNGKAVLDRTEPLLQNNVKAYWGDVIHPAVSHGRMKEDLVGGLLTSGSQPLGWARIIVHSQGDPEAGISPVLEGSFSAYGVVHHIKTKESYIRTKHPLDPDPSTVVGDSSSPLVIFRDSDIMDHYEEMQLKAIGGYPVDIPIAPPDGQRCSHDHLDWNTDPFMNPVLRPSAPPAWYDKFGPIEANSSLSSWVKRDDAIGNSMNTNFADHIGQSTGCPIQQMVVYMGVAADCKYVQQYGSAQNATSAILNDWNQASALYKNTFNVSLAIVQLDMHDPTCPTTPDTTRPWNVDCGSVTLNDRLSLFSQWRGDKGKDGTGLWHLMSGCPTGTEVGVAWLGTLCQSTASGSPGNVVSGTAVTTGGRAEWQVVAHEIGHNFGAIHDCTSGCNSTSPCCPLSTGNCDSNSQFIMSPTSSLDEVRFSPCSLGNICSLMTSQSMDTTCVQTPDPSKQVLSLQMCGNGIVEAGEDCDPGMGNNSTCCDAKTCKFSAGSVCDPQSSPCCTSHCVFAPNTQVCRPSQDPKCDIAEKCTGTSANCPWDQTEPDGQSCGDGLSCASGQCTSPSQQCKTVGAGMGLTTACSNKGDTSCQVSCQDPSNSRQCVVLQAQLINGSPCGYGGKCVTGKCQAGSLLDTIKAWYTSNLQISIPVTVVAGIFALLLIWGLFRCIARCCRRPKAGSAEPALRAVPAQRLSSWVSPSIPPGNPYFQPTAPEPGVWIPPSNASMRNVPQRNLPDALRAGSAASQRSSPPTASNTRGAFGSQDARYPRAPSRQGSDRTHWVDASAWNGPSR